MTLAAQIYNLHNIIKSDTPIHWYLPLDLTINNVLLNIFAYFIPTIQDTAVKIQVNPFNSMH